LRRNQNSTTFRKILQYTYNPYIKYHIRKIPKDVIGIGYGELNHDTWVLLNKLSLRKISGIAARETLFDYMETLTPEACTILKLIIRKDLKAGIATKTINKIMPGFIPHFECQLVEDWVEAKVTYPILISPKLDGTRGEKRGGAIFTRRGHQITGLSHIINYMNTINVNMVTSGELFIPGMDFRRSDGIMRSNKAEKRNVCYALFDVPNLEHTPLKDRLDYLAKTFYPLGSKPAPPVCHIPHIWAYNAEEVDKMYNYWRSLRHEGLVGKDPNGLVKLGKSYSWMRKVNLDSAEFKITGVYESEEKPGYMGGIVIEGGIRVGSGFVDSERIEYLKNPSLIIGRMATIEFKERTASGSLRQPIFKAIRWDI
jgi:DNA ligase-1